MSVLLVIQNDDVSVNSTSRLKTHGWILFDYDVHVPTTVLNSSCDMWKIMGAIRHMTSTLVYKRNNKKRIFKSIFRGEIYSKYLWRTLPNRNLNRIFFWFLMYSTRYAFVFITAHKIFCRDPLFSIQKHLKVWWPPHLILTRMFHNIQISYDNWEYIRTVVL